MPNFEAYITEEDLAFLLKFDRTRLRTWRSKKLMPRHNRRPDGYICYSPLAANKFLRKAYIGPAASHTPTIRDLQSWRVRLLTPYEAGKTLGLGRNAMNGRSRRENWPRLKFPAGHTRYLACHIEQLQQEAHARSALLKKSLSRSDVTRILGIRTTRQNILTEAGRLIQLPRHPQRKQEPRFQVESVLSLLDEWLQHGDTVAWANMRHRARADLVSWQGAAELLNIPHADLLKELDARSIPYLAIPPIAGTGGTRRSIRIAPEMIAHLRGVLRRKYKPRRKKTAPGE